MNPLDRLEALAQSLIEGPFSRLFRTQLHPSDLAHHLAEAIENGRCQRPGEEGGVVPNQYTIKLNPADHAKLAASSDEPVEIYQLRRLLVRLIRDANYQVEGPVEVHVCQSDGIAPGGVEIETGHSAITACS